MDEQRRRFEQLVLPHLGAAYNLARWLAAQDAEDVAQDAMLRAFRAFDGFRGGDAKAWLLTIVRNCHYTAVGRRRKTVPLPEEGENDIASDAPDPERSTIDADRARKLNQAIASLPDEFRETLVLREMEDMSYRDIAQVVGAPIGTVMSRLARARALLRQTWLASGQEAPHAMH
jgi:RNA polymerase sigma factor (sigma-70 family)